MPTKNGQHPVAVIAEVQSMELNLDHSGAYKLRLQDGSTVKADFTASQWPHLESEHNRGRFDLKVVGVGDFTDGRLKRIVRIDLRETERVMPPQDPDRRPFWEYWVEAGKQIPDEDLAKIPPDFSYNLDHYLYGAPKREAE